jgi:hypothetical protein
MAALCCGNTHLHDEMFLSSMDYGAWFVGCCCVVYTRFGTAIQSCCFGAVAISKRRDEHSIDKRGTLEAGNNEDMTIQYNTTSPSSARMLVVNRGTRVQSESSRKRNLQQKCQSANTTLRSSLSASEKDFPIIFPVTQVADAPRARAHIGRGCAGPFFPTNVMLVHVGRIDRPTKP